MISFLIFPFSVQLMFVFFHTWMMTFFILLFYTSGESTDFGDGDWKTDQAAAGSWRWGQKKVTWRTSWRLCSFDLLSRHMKEHQSSRVEGKWGVWHLEVPARLKGESDCSFSVRSLRRCLPSPSAPLVVNSFVTFYLCKFCLEKSDFASKFILLKRQKKRWCQHVCPYAKKAKCILEGPLL